jgi:hypothetical protein
MVTKWQEKGGMVEASEEDMANWLAIKKVTDHACGGACVKSGADGVCGWCW